MINGRLKADVCFTGKVIILDSGSVMSRDNCRIKNALIQKDLSCLPACALERQIHCVRKARETLKQEYNPAVVPKEVVKEVQKHLEFFRNNSKFKYNGLIRNYIEELDNFQRECAGFDPRIDGLLNCRVSHINPSHTYYSNTLEHYRSEVERRHASKNQNSSEADIAIATLTYLLHHEGYPDPCIITRDNDFACLVPPTREHIRCHTEEYMESTIYNVATSSFRFKMYISKY